MSEAVVAESHLREHEELSFWRKYLFSIDHKVIGKQYMTLGLLMALVGGATVYIIRWQQAWPETQIPLTGWIAEPAMYDGYLDPSFYNQLVTMHGTIMVFFVAMPFLLGAFGNFLLPIMCGADDMAFPRLNMMSFWTLFIATMILLSSFFVSGGPAASGWTGYAPLSADAQYTGVGTGMNLWILALALEFSSFLMGGINLLTTTINMRAPGLTFFRLPLMVWMLITASAIFLLSVGPLIAGAIMLLLDRVLGTTFFLPQGGGDPLLWQHLFWFFGHPEVYVILLPAMGAILEILPVFCRKPIFGYRTIIFSTIIAGVLSFLVWAHHMFVSGIDPRLAMPFSITTILISVPFAVIIFSMVATLWGASMTFPTPMLWTLGFLATFLMGGVTGIFNGSAAVDIYIHDTYFVVAHFHYTLFPSVFFGGFAALTFWYPKMFGRLLNETLGKIHFWLTFVFFNLVFLPMFLIGLGGHMRRIYNPLQYEFLKPLAPLNEFVTVAAVCLLLSQIPLIINYFASMWIGEEAGPNPWQANTLEWTAPSPPPHGNFATPPIVYRGPYEYSSPESKTDWLSQSEPVASRA